MNDKTKPSRDRAAAKVSRRLVLAALVVALLLLVVALAGPASADTSFGEAPTPQAGHLTSPSGVAVDQPSGDLYVADGHRIDKFDAAGNSLLAFGWGVEDGAEEEQVCTLTCHASPFTPNSVKGGLLGSSDAITVDPAGGDVFVTDPNYRRVEKFDPSGQFLFAFGGDVVAHGPDNSTADEVQQLTVSATGGTFTLGFEYPYTEAYEQSTIFPHTAPLAFDATSTEVEAALNGLSTIGGLGGSVAVSGGPGDATGSSPYEITFEGNLTGDDVPTLNRGLESFDRLSSLESPSTLSGATHTVAVATLEQGGAAEVCKPALGDVCKTGGDLASGATGTFQWPYSGSVNAIAADTAGTVYVGDKGRVEEFDQEGNYTGEIALPGAGQVRAIAIDQSCALHEPPLTELTTPKCGEFDPANGDVYVIADELAGVRRFDAAGNPQGSLEPSGQPQLLAVDGHGNLFVGGEINSGEPDFAYEFAGYQPDGTHYAQFGSPLLTPGNGRYGVGGLAASATAEELYATNEGQIGTETGTVNVIHTVAMPLPQRGAPQVGGATASDIQPVTATLRAVVNPKGFDTEYHFEYVDQHDFETEGGFGSPHTESTSVGELPLLIHDDPVQEGIFDLKPETTYRFRVLATSHCHEAEPSELCEATGDTGEFTTLPPISVRNFTTQTVAPEEVTIKAELNNNNSLGAGHYTIRFGTDTSYATGQREGSLQGGSGDYEAVEASFTGLNPNTEYHYQLFGENEYGQVETADRTLTTERSAPEERAGEDCPLNGTVHGDLKSPLREEDNSTSLPDCRSYEQVSPAYKAGFPAVQPRLAPSGEAARFSSPGAFAGSERDYYAAAEYAARRTGSGWRTVAVAGEGASLPGYRPGEAVNFTAELDHWLVPMQPGLDGEEALSTGRPGFFSLGSIDGSYVTPASPPLEPFEVPVAQDGLARFFYQLTGASDDLSHVYIATERRLLRAPADPRPEGKQDAGGGKSNRIYELTGAGGGDPVLRLLAEVPTGLTHSSCVIDPFGHEDGAYPGRHTSADGSTFLYANQIEDEAGKPCGEGTPNPTGLFVRALPAAPQQLNVAPPAQCHAPSPCATAPTSTADSVGISGDGSRAWFMTSQPLVEADRDSSQDLYVADLGEEGSVGSLVQASAGEATATHPEPGTGAGVQGVAALSSGTGASNVAFVATGVLTEAPNQLGQVAKPGADNLYLYDAETGATKFVADLCSQAGLSGSSSDDACPNQFISSEGQGGNPGDTSLWRPHIEARQLPQMTPDGRYLIFATYARLVADDTDSVRDIYRFDLSTGSLIRVSFGRDGNDGDGNDDAFPVQIEASGGISYGTDSEPDHAAQDESRAISADGSRVVFSTKAPLVSADTDGSSDVYEWEEDGHGSCTEARGCVYLISSGRDRHGANSPVISSSGRDIAFYSAAGLLPADTDGLGDIYDARVDGGFPRAFEPATCDGPESCRGAATAPSALPSFTTAATQHEPEAIPCGKGRHRVRKHNEVRCVRNKGHRKKHRSKHRRSHRHGRAGAKHGGVR